MSKNINNSKKFRGGMLGSALASTLASLPALALEQAPSNKLEELEVRGTAAGMLKRKDLTATKADVSLKDTGRSIVQLDSAQIEALALENVREAFDYVAGFRGNGPADRTYTARGIRTSIDNVMVDGLRSLQGGEAGTGSRLPSTFNAESVTFLRGPAGLLYGPSVGGGLVNVTTKKPQAQARTTLGARLRSYATDGSTFDSNRASLNLDSTGPLGDETILYRALAQHTPSGDHFQDGREIDETLVDLAMTFNIGDSTTITPRYELAQRERTGGSGYADGVFDSNFANGEFIRYGELENRTSYYGSPDDMGSNDSQSFGVTAEHEFGDAWTLTLRGRVAETESESLDLYISDSSGLGNEIGQDLINRKWVYSAGEDEYVLFDATLQTKFQTGPLDHSVMLGANYRESEVKFARNFQDNDDAVGQNTISASNPDQQLVGPIPADLRNAVLAPRTDTDLNVYIKDRVEIGALQVVGGLAFVEQQQESVTDDGNFEDTYNDTIWDVGVIYALNDDVNVFATYSRSFDPVSARWVALYGQGKTDYKPVEGDNYELGVKADLFDSKVGAGVTLFQQKRINSTRFDRNENGSLLVQLDGTGFKSEGVEIDLGLSLTSQWHGSMSYAYTIAEDTVGEDEGIQADNTPKHSAALFTNYQLGGRFAEFSLGLGLRHESQRNDGDFELEDYTEADVGVYYTTTQWQADLVLRNALDENRAEAGANWVTAQPNEPRALNLSVNYTF